MIPPRAYNPSIVRWKDKLLLSYRHHDRGDWRTNLYISELGDDLKPKSVSPITAPKEIEQHSHEDARLWTWGDRLMISWTVSMWPAVIFRAILCYGELVYDAATGWTIAGRQTPQYGKNDFSGIEKNWVFIPVKNQLYAIYHTLEAEQVVLRISNSTVEDVSIGKALPWGHGPIHGGCAVNFRDGQLLHFFNSRTGGESREKHRYNIGVSVLSAKPPFDVLRSSSEPIFRGEEGVCLDKNPRYKENVVFPCGAAEDGGAWLLSYGWNDHKCRIARLKEEDLKL